MRNLRILGSALPALLLALGCGRPVSLAEQDDGTTLLLKSGSVFEVRLYATPDAGYTWAMAQMDEGMLRPEGEVRFAPVGGIGAGGEQVFRFRAVAPGQSRLLMHYVRGAAPDALPTKTFRIEVIAR